MSTPNWFKWGWYFTLTVESGVQYPSTDLKWDTVESDFLLPQDRLYGGGVGIIQFTSENYEMLKRIVRNGYDMNNFPSGTIKSDLVNGIKTIDWFKSSRSPGGGLFTRDETIEIKKMLESNEGMESQAFFNEKYFFVNNKTSTNAIKNSNLDDECKAFLINVIVLRPASVIPLINTNPSNLDQLVGNTLAIPQLSGYVGRMNNVADGIKMVNLSDLPPIDIDNIVDEGEREPDPDPPDNTPVTDYFDDFNETVKEELTNVMTSNIYYYGNEKTIGNSNMVIEKLMGNMYQVRLTGTLQDLYDNIIGDGKKEFDDVVKDDQVTKPPVNPINPPDEVTSDIYFPVDYTRNGVNFWHPPYNENIKKNMDYGIRTSGVMHNGYDIGGGGINHKIYAVTDGEVVNVGVMSGYGSIIQIKHDNDNYYSFYAHLVSGSSLVSVGDHVVGGQQIAVMGASGGNYAVHLHFELSHGGIGSDGTIDPKPYLEIVDDNKTNLLNPS